MENLKKLRLERKLSQQKLAENFGITQQAIYNYENGITEPDIYMLKKMAAFFHTTVDYLVGYDEKSCAPEIADVLAGKYGIVEFERNDAMIPRLMHHISLYQRLPEKMKDNVDAILEELTSKDSDK